MYFFVYIIKLNLKLYIKSKGNKLFHIFLFFYFSLFLSLLATDILKELLWFFISLNIAVIKVEENKIMINKIEY